MDDVDLWYAHATWDHTAMVRVRVRYSYASHPLRMFYLISMFSSHSCAPRRSLDHSLVAFARSFDRLHVIEHVIEHARAHSLDRYSVGLQTYPRHKDKEAILLRRRSKHVIEE